IRQMPEGLPLSHRPRRNRHLLAMSPDPNSPDIRGDSGCVRYACLDVVCLFTVDGGLSCSKGMEKRNVTIWEMGQLRLPVALAISEK
ncbi:hypothetical protein, partial [Mesobacterium pallidum]|uniref:hypothetical protein n=1 Tax=Mesobacterium pallidum TaxID=2872037 RepID=UPI001EE3023F